jgi:hypothetical protein
MCPRRIRQLMHEIESGRLVRYSNSEGIYLSADAVRRPPAAESPSRAEPPLHCTEPQCFYGCDLSDRS